MTKLLELTSDVVFKAFMISEKTNEYKARLISLITNIPESELLKAKYQSIELPINNKKDKVYKTDIIVSIKNSILSLEMNKYYYEGLMIKNGSYYSKLETEQFDKGDNYLDYKQIIQINFDDFKKYEGNKLVYEFMMREKDTKEIETDLIKSYHIDLTYLDDKEYNKCNEIEKLCLMFKEEINKYEKEIRKDDIMDSAYEELENISKDEKIIGLYDAEAVERKVMNTRLLYAEKTGHEQGVEEEKINIAKNMLKKSMPIEDIIEITGLSKEDLEKL
jgi:predicted transposase/invertase (TIGR01784 family)